MNLIWKDEWRFASKYISEKKDNGAVSWIQYIFLSILFFKEIWISLSFLNFIFKLQESIEEFTLFEYHAMDILSLSILKVLIFSRFISAMVHSLVNDQQQIWC